MALTKRDLGELDLGRPEYYLNRELSELEFHKRVLSEAHDDRNPLLERVKFLSIFSSNMDEFFMKRVGGLKRQMAAEVQELTPDARSPGEQWQEILTTAHKMFEEQTVCYKTTIRPALKRIGISVLHHKSLERSDKRYLREYFEMNVLPILTPLAVDPGHPFPFISNLSLSLAVLTRRTKKGEPRFARVKIPPNRPRLVQIRDSLAFVPLEQVVAANLDLLFPGVKIICRYPFRVTRNADVKRNEEEASDLLEMIQEELRQRRFATVVRLEVDRRTPDSIRQILTDGLDTDSREIFDIDGFINFGDFLPLTQLDLPESKFRAWQPRTPSPLRPSPQEEDSTTIFQQIRKREILVHHPYHSFSETVHRFIEEASEDPKVLAIKMVVYRTARESRTLQSLLKAVENGKQVAVMIELRARFDEQLNIEWVNTLEEAGIHVAYGMLGYKTHCKMTLVVREEDDGLRSYVHIATGNYHSETAKIYTDLGLLTADPRCGRDAGVLFNLLTGHAGHQEYEMLMVAPVNMRERFTALIRRETKLASQGKKAHIIAKMNSLEDPQIVRELYMASMAGVRIDLIVRGICRLRPQLHGISKNIHVISVVGRFLEHSRIFYFRNDNQPLYYIGSADWMKRNLDFRVETAMPIEDRELQKELDMILQIMLSDNRKAWDMLSDGTYRQRRPTPAEEHRNSQELLMQITEERRLKTI